MHNVSTFFGLWYKKKVGPLLEKIFSGFFSTGYRAFRGIGWGKQISLSKEFFSFWYHFSRLSNFFVVSQFFQSVVSKQRFTFVEKRNWEKLTLTNCYSINFGLCAEKSWTFSKTLEHDSQNCSLRDQRKIFRSFSETTIFVWNFSVFEGKDQISCENFYPGLPKAHFACRVQHFEKKKIKVNFSVCGFFKSLCDFFLLWQKI